MGFDQVGQFARRYSGSLFHVFTDQLQLFVGVSLHETQEGPANCFIFRNQRLQALGAHDEMQRVLRPGGTAVVGDLRKDASLDEIDAYVKQSGRSRFDAWITKWTFRGLLLKRAYTKGQFIRMAEQSRFRTCQVNASPIGFEVRFMKPALAT